MNLLKSTGLMLIIGAVLGFVFPDRNFGFLLIPILVVMMSFSLKDLVIHKLSKHEWHSVFLVGFFEFLCFKSFVDCFVYFIY